MPLSGLSPLFKRVAPLIVRQLRKQGSKRVSLAELNQVHLEFELALFFRHNNAQLRAILKEIKLVKCLIFSGELEHGHLRFPFKGMRGLRTRIVALYLYTHIAQKLLKFIAIKMH